MRNETIEAIGGALLAVACLGLTWFVLWIYLPWIWRLYIENARWLHKNGDHSSWIRAVLRIDSWLKFLKG